MKHAQYRDYTARLLERVQSEPAILGLVAVGSMAERSHMPDEWSDHDFWLVVEETEAERYRNEYDWLPTPEEIVLAFRETPEGVKVLYADGHLLEYAVFTLEGIKVAKVNDYRVLLDRAGISVRMDALRSDTRTWVASTDGDDGYLIGQFLTNLVVGVGRYRRGEKLSAHHFVKISALDHFVRLVGRTLTAEHPELRDDLDPRRRFESCYPELGQALEDILVVPIPEAARTLLALADELWRERLPEFPTQAFATVAEQLG
ncbi:hypothetical protein [Haliangium sp.]|uniref:hypothetical protein n=1 Tax=Haliangium sp. TaxID=2663208 RepID=UPI003D111B0F